MIDYELAKELKDNGFPQRGKNFEAYYLNAGEYTGAIVDATMYINETDDYWEAKLIIIPTLSELIDACGNDFCCLDRFEDDTFGAYIRNDIGTNGLGSTPEEAVAKLWLVLNKHD